MHGWLDLSRATHADAHLNSLQVLAGSVVTSSHTPRLGWIVEDFPVPQLIDECCFVLLGVDAAFVLLDWRPRSPYVQVLAMRLGDSALRITKSVLLSLQTLIAQ